MYHRVPEPARSGGSTKRGTGPEAERYCTRLTAFADGLAAPPTSCLASEDVM